ncbi:MAG: DUF1844 domain-containing protein [Verrucomicrobia bacterium]|nr:DUF1844 domain-containing protein [Verrucomicrobiota bacterium]MBT7068100.1 DUF1844 domain-containing protein [Verrucomicrobiota bacterium]MBT7700843.1 DUF1844 domain-containing protein [Verrucomicrobiota bacterium]
MNGNGTQDNHRALFANLVMMLSTSAMQYLGKLANPATGLVETDIDSAQVIIDTLVMLQARSAATLEQSETGMLNDVISSLRQTHAETSAV